MNEPAYTNEYDQPVFEVNFAHIHKHGDKYELMLNGRYFLIDKQMLESLVAVTSMSPNLGLSIG